MSNRKIESWIDAIDAKLQRRGYTAPPVCLRDQLSVGLAIAFASATYQSENHAMYVHENLDAAVIGVRSYEDSEKIRAYVREQREQLLQLRK